LIRCEGRHQTLASVVKMNVTTGGVTGVRRRVVEEARERGVARVGGH
jgi:hypothetical protein